MHEVDGEVFDDGHVLRAVAGPQAGEIVAEDDIEHPMEPVFDAPMGAHRLGEGCGIELGRAEIVAAFVRGFAAALGFGLDHRDHRQAGEGNLAGIAAV